MSLMTRLDSIASWLIVVLAPRQPAPDGKTRSPYPGEPASNAEEVAARNEYLLDGPRKRLRTVKLSTTISKGARLQ